MWVGIPGGLAQAAGEQGVREHNARGRCGLDGVDGADNAVGAWAIGERRCSGKRGSLAGVGSRSIIVKRGNRNWISGIHARAEQGIADKTLPLESQPTSQ